MSDSDVCAQITPRERVTIDDLKVRLGVDTDANLLRVALYQLARHVDLNLDINMFRLRARDRRSRSKGKPARSVTVSRGGSRS